MKKNYPEQLLNSLIKQEAIIFAGGNILRDFSLINPEFIPGVFVKKIQNELKYSGKNDTFFYIADYACNNNQIHWLQKQISKYYSSDDIVKYNNSLMSLLSTEQKLVIYTWYDTVLEDYLKHLNKEPVAAIADEDQFAMLEGSFSRKLIYLLGCVDKVTSLITDIQDYETRLGPGSLFYQKISSVLGPNTCLFLGYDLNDWFDFEDFYTKIYQIIPHRVFPYNYAIINKKQRLDIATKQRFAKKNLKFIIVDNVENYVLDFAQEVHAKRQIEKEKIVFPSTLPIRPYKYLDYYNKDDSSIFMGREKDIQSILGLVLGHKSVVLFGPSGVGKTSLLHAGLTNELSKKGWELVICRIIPDPTKGIIEALNIESFIYKIGAWLDLLINTMKSRGRRKIVVAFDQFEEFFTELSGSVREVFLNDLKNCLKNRSINNNIKLIFCLRQEALHLFHNIYPTIPNPFQTIYHISNLKTIERKEVLVKVAIVYERPWDEAFIDEILRTFEQDDIDTAHISIILTRLWELRSPKKRDLLLYRELGEVKGILSNYLWTEIRKSPNNLLIEKVLKVFVSHEKRKLQVSIFDIYSEIKVDKKTIALQNITEICNELIELRLIRKASKNEDLFELSHDLLAKDISERISEDEWVKKLSKKNIREAIQDWQVTNVPPSITKHVQLESDFANSSPTREDLLFMSISAASNGKPSEKWITYYLEEGGSLSQFYSKALKTNSLYCHHEVLRLMNQYYSTECFSFIMNMFITNRPSLIMHLLDLVERLKANGFTEYADIDLQPINMKITIPAGEFLFGLPTPISDKMPHAKISGHKIFLDEFIIDRFLVTNIEYQKFVLDTNHNKPRHWKNGEIPYGKEYHPVVQVSWSDAKAFAKWCGKRLPTEAEWEKAGFWNSKDEVKYAYPWGNVFDINLTNCFDSHIGDTSPVGEFSPLGDSPYGVSDVAGNVFEWLLDDSTVPFKPFKSATNPFNSSSFSIKMTRGGSYGGGIDQLNVGYREYGRNKITQDDYVGFRCVLPKIKK